MASNENREPGYNANIPAPVRYNESLPPAAKLMYGEITALMCKEGYCYASNAYFAKLYSCSVKTVSRWISKLSELGYIRVFVERGENNQVIGRRIYIHDAPSPQNCGEGMDIFEDTSPQTAAPSPQKCGDPHLKNADFNNKEDNIKNRESARAKKSYGEFLNVFLSDEECKKLAGRFHPQDVQAAVDRLSCYIEQTGKKYKSHYATLLNWLRKDVGDNGSQLVPTVALAERGGVDEWQ